MTQCVNSKMEFTRRKCW